MCRHVGDARQAQTPSNEVMQNTTHGFMGGYGLGTASAAITRSAGISTCYLSRPAARSEAWARSVEAQR